MPLDVALVPSATPSARFTVAVWPIAVPPGAVCCTIAPLPMPMPLSPFTVVCGPMATDSAPAASESDAVELAWKYLIGVTENELIAPLSWRKRHRVLVQRAIGHVGDLAEVGGVADRYRA